MAIVIYVPAINTALGAYPFTPLAFLSPIAAGILLWIWEVVRRFLRRRGYFGGVPKKNANLVDFIRTTSSAMPVPRSSN